MRNVVRAVASKSNSSGLLALERGCQIRPLNWFRNFGVRIREQRGNINSSVPLLAVLLRSIACLQVLEIPDQGALSRQRSRPACGRQGSSTLRASGQVVVPAILSTNLRGFGKKLYHTFITSQNLRSKKGENELALQPYFLVRGL